MLGRTDSRARAILLLVAFVVVAGALGVRLAYWQVLRRDDLAAMAVRQSSTTYSVPAKRGSIYDRSGTVILATSVQRDRLAAEPEAATPAASRRGREQPRQPARPPGRGRGQPHDADDLGARVRRARARPRRPHVRPHPGPVDGDRPTLSGLILEPEQERLYPQGGGGPDTSLAAHLLGFVNREGTGQYGVEQFYQDRLAGTPAPARRAEGRVAATPSRTRPRCSRRARPARTCCSRSTPASRSRWSRSSWPPWIADRAKRVSAVVMDPYTGEVYAYGELPVLRRERLPGDRGRGARPVRRPARVHRLRAGLRVQDADRDRGPRRRHGHARTRRSRTSGRSASTAADEDRQREPRGHGRR